MNLTLISYVLVAALSAGAAWVFQDNRYTAALAEQALAHKGAELTAVTRTRADERAITKTYQEALNAARTREALLRTELDHLHRVSDGLRDQSAEAARRLAAAPAASVLEYAATLGAVHDDCRAAYAELAGKATGHALDVRAHREAWPVKPAR